MSKKPLFWWMLSGVVDFINPAAEKILKYKIRSARGKHYGELFTLIDSLDPQSDALAGYCQA